MILLISFIILLYINNGIILYYGFPMIKALLTKSFEAPTTFVDSPLFDYYYFIIIWAILFLIATIINIFYLKKLVNNNQITKLRKYCNILKFSIIPFWLINIIGYYGIVLLFFFIMFGWVILFIPVLIAISYLILLSTSIYSISYIILLKKNNIITKKQYIINMILQFCFILDIIGIIYLLRFNNKNYEIRSNVV